MARWPHARVELSQPRILAVRKNLCMRVDNFQRSLQRIATPWNSGAWNLRTCPNLSLHNELPRVIRRLGKFPSSRALFKTCYLCPEDVVASANINSG